jgi:hypothetical protein
MDFRVNDYYFQNLAVGLAMTDKLMDLFERQKVLRLEQRGVLDSLYYSGGGLKPEPARLAYQEVYLRWYNNEQKLLHTASWDNPAVQAERRQLRLAEEEAKEVYNVACLGGDAGKAYQLVLDEIKQIDVEIDKNLSRR